MMMIFRIPVHPLSDRELIAQMGHASTVLSVSFNSYDNLTNNDPPIGLGLD